MTGPEALRDLNLTLLAAAMLSAVGVVALRLILGSGSLVDDLAYALPLGLGLFTIALFVLGWAGLSYGPLTLIGAWVLLVALLVIGRRPRKPPPPPASEGAGGDRLSRVDLAPLIGIAVLVAVASILALGRSYAAWDAAAIYAAKGYGMALNGTLLSAASWGSHGLTYPLNIPLGIMTFRLLGVESLPGSKLLFPVFYAGLLFGTWGVLRRNGAASLATTAGVLFVGTVPVVFDHASNGYVNLAFAFYLVFGAVEWIDGVTTSRQGRQWLGGCLLALAAWTRPEGVLLVGAAAIALEIGRRALAPQASGNLVCLLPFAAVAVMWFTFQMAVQAESEMGLALRLALDSLGRGQPHLDAIYRTHRYLIHRLVTPEAWGLASLLALAALLRVLSNRELRQDRRLAFMAVAVCALWGGIVGFYFLVSFRGDLSMWLVTGGDRMVFPFGLMLMLLALVVLSRPGRACA